MVKTLTNIWLDKVEPSPHNISLVSSSTTLFSASDLYSEDDAAAIAGVVSKLRGQYVKVESETSLYKYRPSSPLKHSRLFKSACLCVIEDCMSQLSLLIDVQTPLIGNFVYQPLMYETLSERFGNETNYADVVIGGEYTDMHKMQNSVKKIIACFRELKDEINIFNEAVCIEFFKEKYYRMHDDEEELLAEVAAKEATIKSLQVALRYDRNDVAKLFLDLDEEINEKNLEYKNLFEYTQNEKKYVKKWELARKEQNSIVLKNREQHFINVVNNYKEKVELEDICHHNVRKFYEESKTDCIDEIENWMETYDKEFEEREMQIYDKQHEIEKIVAEKERLQELYEERTKKIEEWLETKRIKKEKEERAAFENWGATKIQAWWRGVMVRKHLGPYSKKKKGKKNKTKKSKK